MIRHPIVIFRNRQFSPRFSALRHILHSPIIPHSQEIISGEVELARSGKVLDISFDEIRAGEAVDLPPGFDEGICRQGKSDLHGTVVPGCKVDHCGHDAGLGGEVRHPGVPEAEIAHAD